MCDSSFFAAEYGRKLVRLSVLALSVIADAMPPLPKGEALAVHAKFSVSPEALPLGELSSECETERARPMTEEVYSFCTLHKESINFLVLMRSQTHTLHTRRTVMALV